MSARAYSLLVPKPRPATCPLIDIGLERVGHPFHVVKNRFGHRKIRYRGLEKNTGRLYVLFALANLVIAKKALLT